MKIINHEFVLEKIEDMLILFSLYGIRDTDVEITNNDKILFSSDNVYDFLESIDSNFQNYILHPSYTYALIEVWNRMCLIDTIPKNTIGVEVGVAEGNHAFQMWYKLKPSHIYLVDTWDNSINIEPFGSQEILSGLYDITKKRFERNENVSIIKKSSSDASECFDDGVLDWVYLDAGHDYDSLYTDLQLWAPKIKDGGLILGHDYVMPKHNYHETKLTDIEFNYPGTVPVLEDYFDDDKGIELFPLILRPSDDFILGPSISVMYEWRVVK